jgi:hypothetical protein
VALDPLCGGVPCRPREVDAELALGRNVWAEALCLGSLDTFVEAVAVVRGNDVGLGDVTRAHGASGRAAAGEAARGSAEGFPSVAAKLSAFSEASSC